MKTQFCSLPLELSASIFWILTPNNTPDIIWNSKLWRPMTEDETNLITAKSKQSHLLLFLLLRPFAELLQLPIPAKIFHFLGCAAQFSESAQQRVWQHKGGEGEGTAHLEEAVAGGETSFCQGLRALRWAVVLMEYFTLWDLQEMTKLQYSFTSWKTVTEKKWHD